MRNALLFGLFLGIFASSEGILFPILFPISIKLTIHRKTPEPVYQVQTIPVYKEVVKKDPSHDKEKHSYGDGYKGSSYGDGYSKTYSKDHHIKGHNYGSGYGTEASKGGKYQAPVAYNSNDDSYVNIGATFSSGTTGKGTSYGSGLVSVKGTGYGGDVSFTGSAYAGDLGGEKEIGYGDDLGNVKGASYGTGYGDDLRNVKGESYGTTYGEDHYSKVKPYVASYDDSSKDTAVSGNYGDGGKGSSGYTTSYSSDTSHKGGGGGTYAVSYDDPPSGKVVQYTPGYRDQAGAKGSGVPYSNYNGASGGTPSGYPNGYGNEDGSKVKGYSNSYEQADVYSSHEYAPPYSNEETYVVPYPPHSSYEERTDNIQYYAGFGSSIYGDSYAKIVYVPRPVHLQVSARAYKQ